MGSETGAGASCFGLASRARSLAPVAVDLGRSAPITAARAVPSSESVLGFEGVYKLDFLLGGHERAETLDAPGESSGDARSQRGGLAGVDEGVGQAALGFGIGDVAERGGGGRLVSGVFKAKFKAGSMWTRSGSNGLLGREAIEARRLAASLA